MDIRAEKKRIRGEMIERRRGLSADEAAERGRAIAERLIGLPEYGRARLVHSYVAMPGEVDTRGFIEAALASGRRVLVPVVEKGRRDLRHAEISSLLDLRPEGDWGIHQPPPEFVRDAPPDGIGLVVVPGLAFDPRGNRIGFGGGYYDRFLSGLDAPKAAVAYGFQVLPRVPTTDRDVAVDLILTEERVYRCGERPA
jgi:5-formyltetrahydrofolate cyclo-ligase